MHAKPSPMSVSHSHFPCDDTLATSAAAISLKTRLLKGHSVHDAEIQALYRVLMERADTQETFDALLYAHRHGLGTKGRWDTDPFFPARLERLFTVNPYVAWTLCLGYPKDTPWLRSAIAAHTSTSWDSLYETLFTHRLNTVLLKDTALLLAFGSDFQLVQTYHRWAQETKSGAHFDQINALENMHGVLRSSRASSDFFVYGLAHMGQLSRARLNSIHVGHNPLAYESSLLTLSELRQQDPRALDPTFSELALPDTPAQWAEYMVMSRHIVHASSALMSVPSCDLSYGGADAHC